MAKPLLYDARADFRGGRNTSVNPDLLNSTELVDCTNARLSNAQIGAIIKRTGCQRMHTTALPTPIAPGSSGLVQWDAPSGKQTVLAGADGKLYYKAQGFSGDFSSVIPAPLFNTSNHVDFSSFRANTSGAPLVLYLCDGVNYYSWDGTTITTLTGVNSAPAAKLLAAYHTRMFAVDKNFLQNLFWSKVGDATSFTTGVSTAGGSAMVDVLQMNPIVKIEPVSASLAIFTNYAIARFTGYSSNDIQIAQDTQGISADVGATGPKGVRRIEQILAMTSERGPYFVTETGVQFFGVDVETDFNAMDRTTLANMVMGHHKGRREIWIAYSPFGASQLNTNVLIYNTRLQNWAGPFVYPFGIIAFSEYIDPNGLEWIMALCKDGFVRHMDAGAKDDVLNDGSGGSTYLMNVELAPSFFGVGPGVAKGLRRFNVQGNLPVTTATHVLYAFENSSLIDLGAITGLTGARTLDYRLDVVNVGHRLRIVFQDASSDIPIINGLVVEAYNYGRPE